jgi:hypothetical protein
MYAISLYNGEKPSAKESVAKDRKNLNVISSGVLGEDPIVIDEDNDVEENANAVEEDVVIVEANDEAAVNSWDSFNGVKAPDGWTYCGKLCFICFGPASTYFSLTMLMGGMGMSGREKKLAGHANQQKNNVVRANAQILSTLSIPSIRMPDFKMHHLPFKIPNVHSTSFRINSIHLDHQILSL